MERKDIGRVATSIKIDPQLWKETKIEAINEEITVSELMEEAIREYIKKRKEDG